MSVSLAGRAALITGATHGIGRGIVEYFVDAGAHIVFSGRDEAAGRELQAKLAAHGSATAEFVAADLTDASAPQTLVDYAVSKLGRLDTIVNSAGIYPAIELPQLTVEAWNHVMRVNLTASMLLTQAGMSALAASEAGRVVLVSSITGSRTGFAGLSHYGASKAGLDGFVRSAAIELARHGVTINSVAPGTILTKTLGGLISSSELATLKERIPVGRIGQPSDIAAAAAFLASTESSFITGQCLVVDGGQTLPEIQ